MRIAKSHNAVFLIPVIALILGMIATAADIRRSEKQRYELLQERFESDAALRFLVRDALALRLQTHLGGFIQALATTTAEEVGATIEHAGSLLSSNFGSDSASQTVHFFVVTVIPEQRIVIAHAYPRPELVGQEISGHPMLRDFDFTGPFGRIDQIGFLASLENDLSFTSASPVLVRRHLFRYPGGTLPLIGIVKINLIEVEKYIDSELRGLGPLPQLEVAQYDPETDRCLLLYRTGTGGLPCENQSVVEGLQFVSEKNGLRSVVNPTPEYVQRFELENDTTPFLEMVLTLAATVFSLLVALIIRARLNSAEQEVTAYRGSLSNKDALTGAIHSIVTDNLTQLVQLAQRVKDAPDMADTERRYLNIALSEINQMRLSLDAKIMADRSEQGREPIQDDGESFSINSVAKVVEAELKRLGSDENIETRVLLDDSLKIDIRGSAYWVESALLAFINASLVFSDEGFVELSLWTETSRSGEPELLARIRDAGVEWSLDDPALNHASITVLKTILVGLGATSFSSAASIAGSQEHVIRFNRT